ncbi:MAG: PHP domain-containing protein [Candidatus Diapherotrites archaeon]
MKLDLHSHSHYSRDSNNVPEKVVQKCKELGMGLAITDHNSCAAWKEYKQLCKQSEIPLVLGEEIQVFEAGKSVGEILGLFMQKEIPPGEWREVLDELKRQDALIVLPHPFDVERKAFRYRERVVWEKKIDCIETFNSRAHAALYNAQAEEYAFEQGLGISAGSDAHFLEEVGRAFVQAPVDSLEEVRKRLKKGEVEVFGERSSLLPHIKTQFAKAGII